MKKTFYFILIIISIFLIYFEYNNQKCNYVVLGDNLEGYNFNIRNYLIKGNKLGTFNNRFFNYSVVGITNDIKNNKTIVIDNQEIFLKKVLRESDMVVIDIGMHNFKLNYNPYDMNKNYRYYNKRLEEIKKLLTEIRKYAQGYVLFIGPYNPTNYYDSKTDELFYDIDNTMRDLLSKYSVIYIDLYNLIKGNNFKNTEGINNQGQLAIAKIITHYLE